jgi:hypothetical protein
MSKIIIEEVQNLITVNEGRRIMGAHKVSVLPAVHSAGVLLLLLLAPAALARDWAQWRGPEQNGVSRETNLPETWSPDGSGENVVWTAPVGGMSSPIVMKGRLYTLGRTVRRNAPVRPPLGRTRRRRWSALTPTRASRSGTTR